MDDWGMWVAIGVAALTTVVGELLRPRPRKDEEQDMRHAVRIERVYGVHGIVVGYRYFVGKVETDKSGRPLRSGIKGKTMPHLPPRAAYGGVPGPPVFWSGVHSKLVPINLARARAMWVGGKKQQKVTA